MILLYRDPKGETIGSVPSAVGKGISQLTNSDWEKKVASLEKKVTSVHTVLQVRYDFSGAS